MSGLLSTFIYFSYCFYVFTDSKMTKKEIRSPLELMRKVFPSLF